MSDGNTRLVHVSAGSLVAAGALDVAVIGGGVIGRVVALELARRGAGRVGLIDHGALGGEASPAAVGLLPVSSHRATTGALLAMSRLSVAMYPELLASIRDRASASPRLARPGLIECAATPGELQRLLALAARRRDEGYAVEMLDETALRGLIPGAAGSLLGGAWFREDATLRPAQVLAALGRACEQAGVQLLFGRRYLSAEVRAGRLERLRLDSGNLVAGTVVLAAGWWSALLARDLGVTLPVRPARGQLVAIATPPAWPASPIRLGEALVAPQADGRLWLGTTVEYSSAAAPSDATTQQLVRGAASIVPVLAHRPVVAQWVGIRPCSTLRRPIIDRAPGFENLFLATGHHRMGYLLAPLTAKLLVALILGEEPPLPLRPVSWRKR
jgi:glycine oxidase